MRRDGSGERPLRALHEANRCVACGLCLPHCPTYRKTESEADSPRGRVMLMRGLFEGALNAEPGLVSHLDRCLACRTCEAVCPSGVKYGELIDGARALLARGGYRPAGLARWLPGLLSSPALLGLSARLRFRESYPAQGERRGAVSLFLGCAAQLADVETLRASIFVLTRLGYEVRVPRAQGCCGAMHQHGGDPGRAEVLARRNIEAFAASPSSRRKPGSSGGANFLDPGFRRDDGGEGALVSGGGDLPILFSASGCGASLIEYGRYGEGGEAFARRAADIVSFLAQAPGWDGVEIAPLPETIAVHEPCSTRNVLGNAADSYRLLERIPQAEVVPLPGNDQCCGAAGLYFLSQPEMARRLCEDKVRATEPGSPRHIVSTNYGCGRWLEKGLRQAEVAVEVVHPVVLLAHRMGW